MLPSPLRNTLAVAAFALAILPLANCNEDDDSTTPNTYATIGPAGGGLISGDDVFELLIPPGALSTNVQFTITPVSPVPGSGALAPAYAIAPANQVFAAPVTLSFSNQAISVPLLGDGGVATFHDVSDYRASAFTSNSWVPLANPSVDGIAGTVNGTTTTVSATAYSVTVPSGGSCVTVTETCPPEDDGGCTTACGPTTPGKCAAYAGSITQSCTTAATSITVSCCYPTGTPTCFSQPEPSGCDDPCQQLPGSTAVSCGPEVGPPVSLASSGGSVSTCCFASGAPVCLASHASGSPAPQCASSSPCAGYPGSTPSSFTDVSDGTEATCCLPVGTLPTTLPTGVLSDGGAVVTPDAAANDASGIGDASGSGDASGGTDGGADGGAALDGGSDADAGISDAAQGG